MAKTKQKKRSKDPDQDTIDRLNNEIRELKSLNRSLLRRLKKLDRNYEEHLEEVEDIIIPSKDIVNKCPSCKSGELTEVIIESLGKSYSKCLGFGCRYRTSAVKI